MSVTHDPPVVFRPKAPAIMNPGTAVQEQRQNKENNHNNHGGNRMCCRGLYLIQAKEDKGAEASIEELGPLAHIGMYHAHPHQLAQPSQTHCLHEHQQRQPLWISLVIAARAAFECAV